MGAYRSQRANPMINLVADNYALSGELIRVVLEGSGQVGEELGFQ
jgi:hypothetical protein